MSKSVKSYESGDSPDCSLILGRDFDLKKSLGRQYFHPEGWPERKPYRIGIIFMGWNDLIGHHLTRADYEKHAGNLRTASIGENWAVSKILQKPNDIKTLLSYIYYISGSFILSPGSL